MHKVIAFRSGVIVVVALVVGLWTPEGTAADSEDIAEKKPSNATVETRASKDSVPSVTDSLHVPEGSAHHVVAYYFHGDVRCASCRKIEAYTKAAIDSAFGEALKSGLLEWKVVNTDSAQNEHFVQDYQLFTKSVVISDVHNRKETRWRNLGKVWELLGNQAKFRGYIQEEIRPFLDPTR